MKIIKVKKIKHHNENRLGLFFDKDLDIIAKIRLIPGCRWSATKRCWHIPYFEGYFDFLNNKYPSEIQFSELHIEKEVKGVNPNLKKEPEKDIIPQAFYNQIKVRRLSKNTLSAYKSVLSKFIGYCNHKEILTSPDNLQQYIIYLIERCNISRSYQNQLINAAKIYFEAVHDISVDQFHFQRVKKDKKLPVVFSEDEVKLLLVQRF